MVVRFCSLGWMEKTESGIHTRQGQTGQEAWTSHMDGSVGRPAHCATMRFLPGIHSFILLISSAHQFKHVLPTLCHGSSPCFEELYAQAGRFAPPRGPVIDCHDNAGRGVRAFNGHFSKPISASPTFQAHVHIVDAASFSM